VVSDSSCLSFAKRRFVVTKPAGGRAVGTRLGATERVSLQTECFKLVKTSCPVGGRAKLRPEVMIAGPKASIPCPIHPKHVLSPQREVGYPCCRSVVLPYRRRGDGGKGWRNQGAYLKPAWTDERTAAGGEKAKQARNGNHQGSTVSVVESAGVPARRGNRILAALRPGTRGLQMEREAGFVPARSLEVYCV